MPAKSAKKEADGFSAQERAAMKERAAELKAQGKKADALQAVLDAIAKMSPDDGALAERVHATITATAPDLSPKTWYGMPAYADADGKVVVFFQDSGKFNYRYSTLGFQDAANLDDGDIWPVAYALDGVEPGGRDEGQRAGEGCHCLRRVDLARSQLVHSDKSYVVHHGTRGAAGVDPAATGTFHPRRADRVRRGHRGPGRRSWRCSPSAPGGSKVGAAASPSPSATTTTPPTVSDIYQQVGPSVAVVRTAKGALGTGVIAADDGTVLTANHVISDGSAISIIFADGTKSAATVASADPKTDIATLTPATLPQTGRARDDRRRRGGGRSGRRDRQPARADATASPPASSPA